MYVMASIIRFLLFDKYGVEIYPSTSIGKGLRMPHLQGIIVVKDAHIGEKCILYHHVTIGANELHGAGTPVIGDNVYIGCGTKIIGRITIGNNVRIGAYAVVTKDVPPDVTVVGFDRTIFKN